MIKGIHLSVIFLTEEELGEKEEMDFGQSSKERKVERNYEGLNLTQSKD